MWSFLINVFFSFIIYDVIFCTDVGRPSQFDIQPDEIAGESKYGLLCYENMSI